MIDEILLAAILVVLIAREAPALWGWYKQQRHWRKLKRGG